MGQKKKKSHNYLLGAGTCLETIALHKPDTPFGGKHKCGSLFVFCPLNTELGQRSVINNLTQTSLHIYRCLSHMYDRRRHRH